MPQCKLYSREHQKDSTVVKVGDVSIGDGTVVVIAGPCSVENREQLVGLSVQIKEMGVNVLRGGAFKPRTSPYDFQGLGLEGLKILAEAREASGLPVITEVMDIRQMDLVCRYADIIQIGSRNMQNTPLLREAGKTDKPVMLKRGLSSTLEEWLLAAEYILMNGNKQVILCERGIRSFETYTRNTFDINAIPAIKHLSHLPLIADPSHGTGRRELVGPVATAALAAGADGIMIEVHPDPSKALSDGAQSLRPQEFKDMMNGLRNFRLLFDKKVSA
ncbi:phospho-2-dehydro-3-deoxyheptonate aldolase [Desulfofarcimen acetoxidans DSM 771]|uniref:Phospho-2-dehydro-3-deoxyheptonate aldolase n=1 Tax=Desulfofarcimen acetoxidans (strain ATCC 49208 / DSM 771 / KCTC 5769 / VKM B-1644 / 5575) TaxID=485916 RepID=C8W339_DESAS|nr:3-deoxy-7-phosphoheptulonate synthase [Desulfofarcimen acetoxidans]ACV61806.1 phospho-2-dehydro-3-deoxyheptonate aldolase [Desulfofarcimen acetoxidans DSM 771]